MPDHGELTQVAWRAPMLMASSSHTCQETSSGIEGKSPHIIGVRDNGIGKTPVIVNRTLPRLARTTKQL